MDFLDPKKERRNNIVLLLGYCLVALAIGIATLVLLYQSYGYGVDRNGNVTQNGLIFVSSQPTGATIKLNGQQYKSNTNTRVTVPANTYSLQISETGYRTWQRQIVVEGGDVQHFDYPFLFPQALQTTQLSSELSADPSIATQSPDKRWLLLGQPANSGIFTEYDMKNPAKPVATTVSLPEGSFTAGDGAQTWTLEEWAADNRHVLLLHTYQNGSTTNREYVLLDRDTPVDSVDLTTSLKLSQTEVLSLFNNRVSQFYVEDTSANTLERINASDGLVVSTLQHVLAYKTYADNEILYISDQSPTGKTTSGQVTAVLQDGQKTIALRTLPASQNYVLNLAQYAGDWYVAVGSGSDTAVYVYKDPQSQTTTTVDTYPAAWRRIPVANPSYLSFSSNTQFLLAENAQNFIVYDLDSVVQYHYHATEPIDQPQTHATWMDGDRLEYVSGGKLVVFDYDYRNRQSLVSANASFTPFFANDYSYLYSLRAASGETKPALTSTSLTVK